VSAAALLSELRRRDIQVRVVGSELRCSAPAGALTPELRAELQLHKNDVLELLSSAHAAASQAQALVPLQRGGGRAPIYGVPGHNGDVFCYRALARALGTDQPFFGLQPPGLDGERAPLERVEDLAEYFAAQIRASGGRGACIVAGYCAGGTVAFELAQALARGGTEVRFLALFGCPYPVYFTRSAQLWNGLGRQLERIGRHGRELAAQSWRGRRGYLARELGERRARLDAERQRAADPVLARRALVERATVAAVRRYRPRLFEGRVKLFLPGVGWQRSGVAVQRWCAAARHAETYFGPDAADGSDMLLERHAPAFAELFRRAAHGGPQ
jgi:thioesterase domain-containing protein